MFLFPSDYKPHARKQKSRFCQDTPSISKKINWRRIAHSSLKRSGHPLSASGTINVILHGGENSVALVTLLCAPLHWVSACWSIIMVSAPHVPSPTGWHWIGGATWQMTWAVGHCCRGAKSKLQPSSLYCSYTERDCVRDGGKLYALPEPERQMRNCFMVASHRIGRWIRNGLVTVPHNVAYLAMFQRGLQGIPLRLESDHCWALAMWPVWRHSWSPRHRGGTILLHPQLGWKFHDSKFYIWLVHCYNPTTQNSAWHIGGAQ